MQPSMYLMTLVAISAIVGVAILTQRIFKKYLDTDQYYYLKDVTIVAVWALLGIWAPEGPLRITIATAVAAACIGFCQKVSKNNKLKSLYFLLAFSFSVFGPRISFVEYATGEYIHLSYATSLMISTLWLVTVPVFLQELDEIPGFCGTFVTLTWLLLTSIVLSCNHNSITLSYIITIGMILILVYWSRHLHPYRRLTEPLSALWGTLIAGISVFAISNGIPFYALTTIPFSFYLLMIIEIFLSAVTACFFISPMENFMFYKRIIKSGKSHISALLQIIIISAILPVVSAFVLLPLSASLNILITCITAIIVLSVYYKISHSLGRSEIVRKPSLWGITVDNISLNYALSKVDNWVATGDKGHIIVTPDALAALRSRTDKKYSEIVKNAGLVLPDGAGLILAMKLLGTPIQERIPGVEFTEHLCRKASYEGWGVWFLGGAPGVAEKASLKLKEKFPDLCIAGTHSGYFDEAEEKKICKDIALSGAKILFVGLGVPKQEYWLSENIGKTSVTAAMGIGGTMDVISGNLKRAPKIWQKFALEWLYRVIQEPYRWKRIIKLPIFLFYLTLTLLHIDFYKDQYTEI